MLLWCPQHAFSVEPLGTAAATGKRGTGSCAVAPARAEDVLSMAGVTSLPPLISPSPFVGELLLGGIPLGQHIKKGGFC